MSTKKAAFAVAAVVMLSACGDNRLADADRWGMSDTASSGSAVLAQREKNVVEDKSLKPGAYRIVKKNQLAMVMVRILASGECSETRVTSFPHHEILDQVSTVTLGEKVFLITATEKMEPTNNSEQQTQLTLEYNLQSKWLTFNGKFISDTAKEEAVQKFAAGYARIFGKQCEDVRKGREPADKTAEIAALYLKFFDAISEPSKPEKPRKPIELQSQAKGKSPA